MSRGTKFFLLVASTVLLSTVLVAGAAATTWVHAARSERIGIDYVDQGSRVSLHVPASLGHVALSLVPRDSLREVAEQAATIGPVFSALEGAADAIADAPDFVILEVVGSGEHVVVEKVDGRMVVRVEDGAGFHVEITCPVETFRRLCRKLDRTFPA